MIYLRVYSNVGGKMSMVEDTVPHRVWSTCVFSSYFCKNVHIFTGYLVHNMTLNDKSNWHSLYLLIQFNGRNTCLHCFLFIGSILYFFGHLTKTVPTVHQIYIYIYIYKYNLNTVFFLLVVFFIFLDI